MFNNYPDIVSTNDIAKMLNIGKSSVYALLQSKQIQHVRVGRKYVVPKQAVINFASDICYNENKIVNGRLQLVTKGDVAQ